MRNQICFYLLDYMFALSILFCKQGSAIERLLNDKAQEYKSTGSDSSCITNRK